MNFLYFFLHVNEKMRNTNQEYENRKEEHMITTQDNGNQAVQTKWTVQMDSEKVYK